MSDVSTEFRGLVGLPFQAESIGQRLKRLRLERGLSQRDLSSPGVSYAYISRIEAGARSPSVKALRMLAQKLAVSVEYLETGRDIAEADERELRLIDAELELRLGTEGDAVTDKLDAILEEAVRAGDLVAAQRARVAMAMGAERRGDHLGVVERLEQVVSGDAAPSPVTRSEVYTMLGRAYGALGSPERAVRLFERCLEHVERDAPTDVTTHIRYATFLSYALTDANDYERAGKVIAGALGRAGDTSDAFTRIRLYWSLARLQVLDGRSGEALENIRHAIALLEVTEDTLMLARANLLAAGATLRKNDAGETHAHLEQAEILLGSAPEQVDVGMLRIGQSRLACLEGRADDAVELARDGLALLGTYHGGEQGAAVHALADSLALQGDEAGADEAYRRAVDLLIVHGRRRDAAQATLDWAEFLRQRGRSDEANRLAERAAKLGLASEAKPTTRN
jgi:transcriptional regulator with XRE-family HTH domain